MKNTPKVSIIVIVYQVERFLEQCLASVTAQDYENLEIVVVLGLGEDRCEEICDSFAARDSRIRLIKDTPKGVAVARNQGLEAATGEYIGFVDGDDWAEPDMFRTLAEAALRHDADVSVVGKYLEYENLSEGTEENKEYVLNHEQAFDMILYQDGFFLHLWDKLFRRSMFEGLRFPVGERIEDRKMGYRLLDRANRIVYNTASKYHFRISADSGSQVSDNLALSLEADKEITSYLLKRYPSLQEAVTYFMVYENISVIQNNMLYGIDTKEGDRPYYTYVKRHAARVLKNKRVERGVKMKVLLCMFAPGLLKKLTLSRRKKFLDTHKHFHTGTHWDFTEVEALGRAALAEQTGKDSV